MSAITKQTAAPAVTSRKPPSTATKMPITAPVEAAAPIPSKQPQSTAPAGSWAKKLPALTKSSSTAGSAAPNISAGRAPQPTVFQATAASTSSVPAGAGGDSGNQANALSTNGILSFGNGLLDLVEGYEYNEEQIMTFLNTVYNKKTVSMDARYVAKGIQEFILTANNDMTKTLATLEPPKNPNDKAAVHKNAEELRKTSEAQLQGPKSFDSVPSIPIRNSALWKSGTEAPPSKDVRQLPFLGVNLPMITVYDYLAWLLSILGSAEAKSAEKTAPNYYLPLLALFSRWCTVIANLIKFKSLPMVHISWWGANVLLGSSLGEVPEVPGQGFEVTKETLYVQPRQRILNSLGYKQPPPDIKGKQRYGRCAETFLFIVAKTISKFDTTSVKGFAIEPPELEELPINQAIKAGLPDQDIPSVPQNQTSDPIYQGFLKYQTSSLYLANPCPQSCQALFKQMRWEWTKGGPLSQESDLDFRFDVDSGFKNVVGVAPGIKTKGSNNPGDPRAPKTPKFLKDPKDPKDPKEVPPPSGIPSKTPLTTPLTTPSKTPPKNRSETLGIGGVGGKEPPDFVKKVKPWVPEPFAYPLKANLTPGQRFGKTDEVMSQNRKAVAKASEKTRVSKLTGKNVRAAYNATNPTPSQMAGSTMATIAGSAVKAAAPAVVAHVASAWGK